MMIVAVLGLSGVGKSTLVRKAAAETPLLHLAASDLIKARLAQSSEELRKGAVLDNQALMLAEFADRASAAGDTPIVFDGHSIIDTPNGLLEIPLAVFEAIKPSAVLFVEADPSDIVQRRARDVGRARQTRSVEDLMRQQAAAKARAQLVASELGKPFQAITPDSVAELVALLA